MITKKRIDELIVLLEENIHYKFKHHDYIKEALNVSTLKDQVDHKDNLSLDKSDEVNEALATVGDAVLKLVLAEYYYHIRKDNDFITKEKLSAESNENLSKACRHLKINYSAYKNNGSTLGNEVLNDRLPCNSHSLGTLFEAVVAAVYFDSGYEHTKLYLKREIIPILVEEAKNR